MKNSNRIRSHELRKDHVQWLWFYFSWNCHYLLKQSTSVYMHAVTLMIQGFRFIFRYYYFFSTLSLPDSLQQNNGVDQSPFFRIKFNKKRLRYNYELGCLFGRVKSFEAHHLITECLALGLISHRRWSDPEHFSYTATLLFALLSGGVFFFILPRIFLILIGQKLKVKLQRQRQV